MKVFLPRAMLLTMLLACASIVHAAQYKIDASHSFVEFRIQHLGYSCMKGSRIRLRHRGSSAKEQNSP